MKTHNAQRTTRNDRKKSVAFCSSTLRATRYGSRGFSLFETLFVIGLFAFLGSISLPFTIDAYRHYLLSSETKTVVSVLRRAQGMAMANKYGENFGVSIQAEQYVLFQGESYAGRSASFDELYPHTSSITIEPVDIVFETISGAPDVASTITILNTNTSQEININALGTINW